MQVQRILVKNGLEIEDHQPDDFLTKGCFIGHTSLVESEKVCKIEDFAVPYKDMGLSIIGVNGRSIYKVGVLNNEVRIIFKTEEQY